MIDVKDEILEGEPRYNILDNNGTPIQNNVQINLATPVLQPGTPINKGLFDSIKNDISLTDKYNLPDSITSMSYKMPNGKFVSENTSSELANAVYGNGVYVKQVTNPSNMQVYYSLNNNPRIHSFSVVHSSVTGNSNVIFDGTQFICMSSKSGASYIHKSTNGENWSTEVLHSGVYGSIALFYVNNKYIYCYANGNNNRVINWQVSENLTSWTSYSYQYTSSNVGSLNVFAGVKSKNNMLHFIGNNQRR